MPAPRRDRRGRFARATHAGVNDDVWKRILKDVRKLTGMRVHVGVMASKGGDAPHDEEGGLSLIELAAIHEFGSPAAKIPERSFIRRTFDQKRELAAATCEKAARALIGGIDPVRCLNIIGLWGATEVKKTVTEGEHIPPPLKPATIAKKGSDRPLVDTGRLIASVSWEVVDRNGEVVG